MIDYVNDGVHDNERTKLMIIICNYMVVVAMMMTKAYFVMFKEVDLNLIRHREVQVIR